MIALAGVAWILTPQAAFADDPKATTGTSILHYDSDGNVVGREHETETISGPPPRRAGRRRRPEPGLALPRLVPGTGSGFAGGPRVGAPALPRYEPNEILIANPDPDTLRRAQVLGYVPLESRPLDALGIEVLRLRTPGAAATPDALNLFRRAFPGATSDFNTLLDPSIGAGVPEGARTVGWQGMSPTCGAGLKIGMIDTPVDVTHVALRGRRIVGKRFVPEHGREASAGHGTAIATLLVGDPDIPGLGGLLPAATLMAASIFEQREHGRTVGNLLSFMMALDWMAQEKVTVINMSLETIENAILSSGLDRARQRGIVMAAAAGNGGAKAKPAYPAAHPEVLAVTAVSLRLLPFQQANQGAYIDFSAPGVRLWTAAPGGGGRYQSGTSLAVPFVTAIVALEIATGMRPDPQRLREALIPGVKDLGAPGKDDIYGWGLIRFRPPC